MAKKLEIVQAHTLDLDDATERTRRNIEKVAKKYGLQINTTSLPFTLKGMGADGKIEVTSSEVRINLRLGLPASMMVGQIKKEISEVFAKELGE